jgi:hypothetical protein
MKVTSNNASPYPSLSSKPFNASTKINCIVSTNDENNSTWFEGNLHESSTKKPKMSNGTGLDNRGRIFGEEVDGNHAWDQSLLDTSQISIETKDTTISGLTYDDHHSPSEATESDCATDTSGNSNTNVNSGNIAHLRGLLDDFGKHNKCHYDKNHAAPSADDLDRPLRPKIGKTRTVPPVSVPTTSSSVKTHALTTSTRGNCNLSSTSKPIAPSFSSSKHLQHRQTIPCTSHIAKSSSTDSGNHATKPRFPVRATPVRLKPKIKSEDVQATNEGYASVAQLSAWLADDPTSTKKVKQIRRGANVIAKSRKFDKDLVNVIIEKSAIPRGGVSKQREIIEKCFVSEENDDEVHVEDGVAEANDIKLCTDTGTQRTATDWMRLGAPGSDIGICVSDKKKWLSSAFKKEDDVCVTQLKKAATEIITNRDRNDELSNRAKQLWRNKHSPVRETGNLVRYNSKGVIQPFPSKVTHASYLSQQVQSSLNTASTETISSRGSFQSTESSNDVPGLLQSKSESSWSNYSRDERREAAPSQQQQELRSPMRHTNNTTHQYKVIEDNTSVDFAKAREQLVLRSKANGNPVDLSKVQRRKAKFEMMEKQARRMSGPTGMLKASWGEDYESSKRYVKKFVEDVAPKKSFEDLP